MNKNDSRKSRISGKLIRDICIHLIFVCAVVAIIGMIFARINNWNVLVNPDEAEPNTSHENFDTIFPLFDADLKPVYQEAPFTIVAFGNAPFADDRDSEDNLANIIADKTGATVYNCSISGSYLASQNSSTQVNENPMNVFCLYWLLHLGFGSPVEGSFETARIELGEDYPAEAQEVLETLTTLDFNEVDVITIMYDASDYLLGHGMYSDSNSTDINTFTGNLEASIELIQSNFPHIRIIVMSPTYAYAVDRDGNYISSDQYIYNNRDVLSTYVIKQYASSLAHNVSFIDNLYNTITSENAGEYLLDNLHLNTAGRRLVANRFIHFLYYYQEYAAAQ